eukprot:maker-scaffold94_size379870-snap-gene-2.32 protein:Tk09637 transcript:maker-scaffold94_size379870-snap-gene-2.32-mRNA-1 annotation:"gamma-crystallin a"
MKVFIALALVAISGALGSKPSMFPKSAKSGQENQYIDCYDFPGYEGIGFRVSDYETNLAESDFDNMASSCCFNGIWILYDLPDYNANNLEAVVFNGWGEGYCTDFPADFDNRASSIRFAGAPDGYKYDTINFYEGKNFMGLEQFFYDDAPQFNYDNLGRSVIVTGCSPWTIYQYDNYQGYSACLYPSDTENCYPSFFPEPSDLGFLSDQVSSAKKGCFSNNKIHGKTLNPEHGSSSSYVFIALALVAISGALASKPRMFPKSAKSGQLNQYMDCYDLKGQGGISFRVSDYETNLAQSSFDNMASSCCFNGIWILYDLPDYNANNLEAAVFNGWGESYCADFAADFDNKASSIRFSGAPDGYKYDTINFYEGKNFMGLEQFFYDDAPQFNYDNLGRSVIVTGCSPWTIYQYDNYQGYSACLYPSDTANCYPSFFPDPSDLGFLSDQVSSTKKGCFSNNKIHGKTLYPEHGSSSSYAPKH